MRRIALAEWIVLGAGLAAIVAKVLRASGAPREVLTLALILGALACALTLRLRPERRLWLDGHRLVLVLLALASVSVVYPRLGGDGYQYYILLRSPLFDGDL